MKITKSILRQLIYEELSNSSTEHNPRVHKKTLDEPIIDFSKNLEENFESVEDQNLLKESEIKIEELKNINEEIRRMKQLVDFRSPLLSGKNL
jgi:hypothetical protein